MTPDPDRPNNRVLVIDDNLAIHEDYRKIFNLDRSRDELVAARADLFDDAPASVSSVEFELVFADQGELGCEKAAAALKDGQPFAVAFVDMRMPPGWDGVQTIEELWRIDPTIQVVLATAYSDQSWEAVLERIGGNHQLLILRKPFENIEVWQIAHALCQKWKAELSARIREASLEQEVSTRTVELEQNNAHLVAEMAARQQLNAQRLVLERRLLESQKLESLGVVASGIAHDFNNLLTAVVANASLLRDDNKENSGAMECIRNIESASMTAAGLCHQMLAYAGKTQFELTDVDFTLLVQDLVELLRSVISKKCRLSVNLLNEPLLIHGDGTQLKQVVMNLVANASDALEDEVGEIVISTQILDCDCQFFSDIFHSTDLRPGKYVALEVRDTGCGMSPEVLARIFDPFFTTKFIGRGLGLASVQGIVRSHGGTIKVTSVPNEGTTFLIMLPVSCSTARSKIAAPVASAIVNPSGRILLVDDEAIVRSSTQRILQFLGYESTCAQDGREAIALIKEAHEPYALVILDLTMPVMGGLETLREIRRLGSMVPVLLTSGYNLESVGPELCESNCVRFLSKPYEIDTLRDMVAGFLGKRT
ncbi:MAG: response regulator [Candidatus Didemnitutus sp.]|nr:response regulator [Candidatus Didemnitutus sp.]